jgi:hypothetical protein
MGRKSADVFSIGYCEGCDRMAELDAGACHECLSRRGRRWVEMSWRCRTDPEFARAVYARIATVRGRMIFAFFYGDPRAR